MKLYVAKDSDGTLYLYTKMPVKRSYETGHYEYDPNGGQCAEVPDIEDGDVYELNFV